MQKKRRARRSAAEWSEIVASWNASGESAARYGSRHGLSAESLYVWRSRLSKQDKGTRRAGPRSATARGKGQFTEVVVRPPTNASSAMEVVTPSGHRVRVRGTVDAVALRTLLQVLESC